MHPPLNEPDGINLLDMVPKKKVYSSRESTATRGTRPKKQKEVRILGVPTKGDAILGEKSSTPEKGTTAKDDDEQMVIRMPRYRSRMMKRIALKLGWPLYYRVRLDERSEYVWKLINGKRCVGEIRDAVAGRFDKSDDEALGELRHLLAILEANALIEYVE